MVSKLDWSYLAGLWEGEGWAGLYCCGFSHGKRKKKRIEAGICQKEPTVLIWVKNTVGYGKIYKKKGYCEIHQWLAYRKEAQDFLKGIYPFMKFRQQQIKSLIL